MAWLSRMNLLLPPVSTPVQAVPEYSWQARAVSALSNTLGALVGRQPSPRLSLLGSA